MSWTGFEEETWAKVLLVIKRIRHLEWSDLA
jgi:hypothetical protein